MIVSFPLSISGLEGIKRWRKHKVDPLQRKKMILTIVQFQKYLITLFTDWYQMSPNTFAWYIAHLKLHIFKLKNKKNAD